MYSPPLYIYDWPCRLPFTPAGYDLHFNHRDVKMNTLRDGAALDSVYDNELMHVNGHFKARLGTAY